MGISNEVFAFLLVLGAGFSTCIGGAVVYFPSLFKLATNETLAASLGLSAGVMLYVSFAEILVKSQDAFAETGANEPNSYTYATLCFFGGFVIMLILDKLVHMIEPDTHESLCVHGQTDMVKEIVVALGDSSTQAQGHDEEMGEECENSNSNPLEEIRRKKMEIDGLDKVHEVANQRELRQMGITTALAIGLHNFPEGLATFVATLDSPHVGVALAVAIAIHNIPEGLCVAMPIYFATGDSNKAFLWSLISGFSEVVAAALAWAVLANVMSDYAYAVLFGLVSGMMVNICIYQLIPTAHKYDPDDKVVSHATLLGMGIMAISLIAFMY